jgi:uncharacterized membrane protein (DUF4010 family)
VLSYGLLFLAMQVVATLAERHFGNLGLIVASGIGGLASSASATAAAANLASNGAVSSAAAGTAAVIASMASALTNLPLVFKHLPRPALRRVAISTALQVVIGITVLAIQRFLVFR